MIDFVIVSSDLQPYVLNTWVKSSAELSTDHHLPEVPVHKIFNSHIRQNFDSIPREIEGGH